jgi:long-chain acyl-CoA synthetase
VSEIDTKRDGSHSSITAALLRHAAERTLHTAFHFEADSVRFNDLHQGVSRLASYLLAHAVRGDKIALYLPNSPALAVFFLAGVRAGCDVQVFDHEWPHPVVQELLAQLSPALLISSQDLGADHQTILIEDPCVPFIDIADLIGAPESVEELDEPPPLTAFYTGFTSGSTGPPKGFRRDHRSWLESFANDQIECPIDKNDVLMVPGALSHSLFLYALVRGIHAGCTVVFCRRFFTRNVARLITRHQATILYCVPAQIGSLVRSKGAPFGTLRRVFTSGAKWPAHWQNQYSRMFPNAELCEFYGASELSFVAIAKASESPPIGSVGRAFSGVTIHITDATGKSVPAGRHGLVGVESKMVFLGYAGGRESPFGASAGHSTAGDIGYLDDDGYLYLVGRVDRMVVVAGKNVYPEEIENILQAHTAISAAAVIAEPDEKRGQRLVAIINNVSSTVVSRRELVHHCQEFLPPHKVPKMFALCTNWPQTRSGKTDTQTLVMAWRERKLSTMT